MYVCIFFFYEKFRTKTEPGVTWKSYLHIWLKYQFNSSLVRSVTHQDEEACLLYIISKIGSAFGFARLFLSALENHVTLFATWVDLCLSTLSTGDKQTWKAKNKKKGRQPNKGGHSFFQTEACSQNKCRVRYFLWRLQSRGYCRAT